jgi:curli biogenesis system outer membrane secretion channel CsgG
VVFQALPPYSGNKAKISLADFDVTATKASSDIGRGLYTFLATTLVNSNRFSVSSLQPTPQSVATDLIINTVVVEFEPQSSGGRAGIGGGGSVGSGLLGGLLGISPNKAHLVLDLRIVDGATSKVIATTRLKGQASDSAGINSISLLGNIALGENLSKYARTPMEKAIRICIIEAVRYIAQNVPPSYFKY